jgi:hypothetical protein
LQSLNISNCSLLTDASIISIITYCTGLQSLDISLCNQLTDDSIRSISMHYNGLQSLNVYRCRVLSHTMSALKSNYPSLRVIGGDL